MFVQVEVLEVLEGCPRQGVQIYRRRSVLTGPVAGGEDSDRQVNPVHVETGVTDVALELLVDGVGQGHIFEHAF